ncbi:MAG: serine hydrolase domain-containing protein [Flavobacteriaceae bacterium]
MKTNIICITILFLSLISCKERIKFSSSEDLIKKFQKELIEKEITGSNEIVVYKDDSLFYRHTENTNKEYDKKIHNETIFALWSTTKVVTTIGMFILEEKNLIDLNDPVSKYIPSFSNLNCMKIKKQKNANFEDGDDYCLSSDNIYPCENQMKIIDLMSHRSGFCTPENFYVNAVKADNLEELMEIISKHPLQYEPGTKYLYGVNQSILGRVIEIATNMQFGEFLDQYLFTPLDMNNTKFYLTNEDKINFQPLFLNTSSIKGFLQDGITSRGNILTYDQNDKTNLGAEGLLTTTSDFMNFCKMLVNNGIYNGKKIISPESIKTMTKKYSEGYPREDRSYQNQLGYYMGLSVYVLEDPNIMNQGAPKGIYGWSGLQYTEFWIDPKNSMFVIFMTRSQSYKGIQEDLIRTIYKSIN